MTMAGRPGPQRPQRSGEYVQSLERGLAVIRAFDAEHPELTLSDVARATGLTRAAARRFLLTLRELGYVRTDGRVFSLRPRVLELGYVRTDGRVFSLRPRVLELGYSYVSSIGLPEVAQPHMEELVAQVHESCSLSVLDGRDIVYVARVPTHRIMAVVITVGTRFPAYATSMGRVLLAGLTPDALDEYLSGAELVALTPKTIADETQLRRALKRVTAAGYAMVDQELEVGLRSIAVPVRVQGQVAAALNVSMHVGQRTADSARREILPLLRDTARVIEDDLAANHVAFPALVQR
jgi:IclR family pca regulon transcriptional regulator